MNLQEYRKTEEAKRAQLESTGLVAAEEKKLLKLITQESFDEFMRVVFDVRRADDDAFTAATMNVRLAISHMEAAKIKIIEKTLGYELSPDQRMFESNKLAQSEPTADKLIQLGLILDAMHKHPRGAENREGLIAEAALKAVGCEAESWAAQVMSGQAAKGPQL